MKTGLPFITVKFAMTLDARIATSTGSSQWISSLASQRLAHKLRTYNDAVMVGAGTIIRDNPRLTVRLVRGRSPTRIVLDSGLRVPPDSLVFEEQEAAPTIVATTSRGDDEKVATLGGRGIEVLVVQEDERGRVDLARLLGMLAKREISSVLVEGGAETITSFLRLNLVDRLVAIVAPKLMGRGIEAVGELNITDVDKAIKLSFTRTYRSGEDIVVEGRVEKSPSIT